ncbi:hypothetical protein [Streptomyces hygroscopicus]|uniref:hypothetical protein n=1 Tax=Streptomyces hygroscopicus TaxID=1912 RepID=UPI0007DB24B4|nr:hypothetical protein [Streptomyces sp. NBRC 109436]
MLHAGSGGAEVRQRMDGSPAPSASRPGPGSTGTRDVDAALIAARHRLPGARAEDDSALTAGAGAPAV